MKTNFSTLIAVTLAVAIGCHSAQAGLIGMPLHLKAAIDLNDLNFQQFYTDDILTGPLLGQGVITRA